MEVFMIFIRKYFLFIFLSVCSCLSLNAMEKCGDKKEQQDEQVQTAKTYDRRGGLFLKFLKSVQTGKVNPENPDGVQWFTYSVGFFKKYLCLVDKGTKNTLLHWVALYGYHPFVSILFTMAPDSKSLVMQNLNKDTPLHFIAANNRLKRKMSAGDYSRMVYEMVRKAFDLDALDVKNNQGLTFMDVARHRNLDFYRIAQGAIRSKQFAVPRVRRVSRPVALNL